MKSRIVVIAVSLLFVSAGFMMADDWQVQTVESEGEVGFFSSLVIDSQDHPHIAHCDRTCRTLKHDFWNGSEWVVQTVDTVGPFGHGTNNMSIVLDSDEYPRIAYYDYNSSDLKYACWDGSSWQIEKVDEQGDVGKFASLKLDSNGHPHIAYCDWTVTQHIKLKYARWDGSAWQFRDIDILGIGGLYASLCLDSEDRPHISYHERLSADLAGILKYAYWDGSDWCIDTVDVMGLCGAFMTGLALDSLDHPHISYLEYNAQDLRYARWDGSRWWIETVDFGDAGWYSSIALDALDHPHISYGGPNLWYTTWDGSHWTIEPVHESPNVFYTSITFDGLGRPHISFCDYKGGGNTDLVLASRIPTGVREQKPDRPLNQVAVLNQCRPNPFSRSTTVSYELKVPCHVTLEVRDIAGRKVRTLIDSDRTAGSHTVRWDGKDELGRSVKSGVYFCRLDAGGHRSTSKIVMQ